MNARQPASKIAKRQDQADGEDRADELGGTEILVNPRYTRLSGLETEAEKARYQLGALPAATARRMSEAEIKSIVDRLADIARVLIDADPEDKAEVFRQLGLKLTYHPGRKLVEANVQLAQFGFFDGVRGGT